MLTGKQWTCEMKSRSSGFMPSRWKQGSGPLISLYEHCSKSFWGV